MNMETVNKISWNSPRFKGNELKYVTEVLQTGYAIPTRVCPCCGKILTYKTMRNYLKSKEGNKKCKGCSKRIPVEKRKEKERLRKKRYYQINKKRLNQMTTENNRNNKERHQLYVKRWKINNKEYNDEKERIRAITKHYFKNRSPCKMCGSIENLEFHHLIYKRPVENKDFIVLCKSCHAAEHARIRSLKQ